MVDVRNAKPGDILIDDGGKQWRVYGYCNEPTVFIEEIDTDDENRIRLIGGVSGKMWSRMSRAS